MAHLARNVVHRGIASGGMALSVPAQASGGCIGRAMSTSSMARSTGSLVGRYSVKVKGDAVQQNVNQAMEMIERRERMIRVPQVFEKHRYHEKGFNKTRRQKSRKKWREEFDAATRQLNWMTYLKDKGVPIPGQRVGERK